MSSKRFAALLITALALTACGGYDQAAVDQRVNELKDRGAVTVTPIPEDGAVRNNDGRGRYATQVENPEGIQCWMDLFYEDGKWSYLDEENRQQLLPGGGPLHPIDGPQPDCHK